MYDIEELKPPGVYGVRDAVLAGIPREGLKQSLLDRPEKVTFRLRGVHSLVGSSWCCVIHWHRAR